MATVFSFFSWPLSTAPSAYNTKWQVNLRRRMNWFVQYYLDFDARKSVDSEIEILMVSHDVIIFEFSFRQSGVLELLTMRLDISRL